MPHGMIGMGFMNKINDDVIRCRNGGKIDESETVIPPGCCSFTTTTGPPALSERNVQDISGIDGGANVFGSFRYADASGHSYETTFCAYRLATGAVSSCSKWNDITQIN